METKHCVNCQGITETDGYLSCLQRIALLVKYKDNEFLEPFYSDYDANTCPLYKHLDNSPYESKYIDFLEDLYELPDNINREKILRELGYEME